MNKYDKKKLAAKDKAGQTLAIISGIFLCISTVFMFINMVTRTVADVNIQFVYDLCSLCAAGVASFAIPYASLKAAHTTMDTLICHLPMRVRAVCEGISCVITAAFMIFTVYVLANYAYQRTLALETTTTAGFPTYVFRWVYALGMFFALIVSIIDAIDMFRIAGGKDVVLSLDEAPSLQEETQMQETEDKGEAK